MPKKKVNPYALSYPRTPNPMKEMSWCIENKMYVSCDIEAFKVGSYWEMGKMYRITIKHAGHYRKSDYIYTKDDVVDAIYETYKELYKRNYAKQTKVNGD